MSKPRITLKDLFNLPTAEIFNLDKYKSTSHVSIDSRSIVKNSIFVAIRGERLDGHQFVKEALQNGAGTVIINRNQLNKFYDVKVPIITVRNTLHAYGNLARMQREKLKSKIVSITGSNGKTTTKEFLAPILSEKFIVEKSIENNNNHIGVPLTILAADARSDVLIIEHGTNHFNEIKYTAEIAQPDISLITNIGDAHLEFLKDRKSVYQEKSSLLKVTDARGGIIILNVDDPILKAHVKSFSNVITYGFRGKPDVKGKMLGFTKDGKTKIRISYKKQHLEVELPVYGISNAKNILSAAAISFVLGLTERQIINGIRKLRPVDKRLSIKAFEKYVLINDTYNSNPDSVKAAIDLVKTIKTHDKKVLILGDMFELGKQSPQLHRNLAASVNKNKFYRVFTIGKMMKHFHEGLNGSAILAKHFRSRNSLGKYLDENDLSDSVILIKGSRGMRMEEFVELLEEKIIRENIKNKKIKVS